MYVLDEEHPSDKRHLNERFLDEWVRVYRQKSISTTLDERHTTKGWKDQLVSG